MAKHSKNSKATSFEDFEAYLKGSLSERRQHAFEKKMIDDDFEAEALEGLEKFDVNDVRSDLSELNQRYKKAKSSHLNYMKIAAVIALFISATIALFFLLTPRESQELSQKNGEPSSPEVSGSLSQKEPYEAIQQDSTLISQNFVPKDESSPSQGAEIRTPQEAEVEEESLLINVDVDEIMKSYEVENDQEPARSSADRVNYSMQKIQPIEERELEPIPEIGEFNRVTSARVKPSNDPFVNERRGELPSKLMYPEGMNEVPDEAKKESLSITMAGKRYSKSVQAKPEAVSSAPSAATENVVDLKTRKSQEISPVHGFDKYYEYIYGNIQQIDAADVLFPKTIDIELEIAENGKVKKVNFLTQLDKKLQKEIERIIVEGPAWSGLERKEKGTAVIPLKLEF